MIGSLLYLTVSKHDIMFNVCLCARFQKQPREVHLIAIKFILRYLIGTSNLGLMFKRREGFRLTRYYDADYAGDKVKRKKHKWKLSLYWWQLSIMDMQEAMFNCIVHC